MWINSLHTETRRHLYEANINRTVITPKRPDGCLKFLFSVYHHYDSNEYLSLISIYSSALTHVRVCVYISRQTYKELLTMFDLRTVN